MPHLNCVAGRAAVDGVADQRELVAVGRRRQRAAVVMHVNRIAADQVGRGVQRREGGAPEIAEQRVANVRVGDVHGDRVAARAGRALGADDDVARQIADVRQEVEHAVQVARAEVIELQRARERHDAAVGRNRRDGPLFPLVLRVDPAATRDLALLDVPRVGDDEPVAGPPPETGARTASSVVCPARGSTATREKVGVIAAPCIVILPKLIMPVPNCSGSATPPPGGVFAMRISAVHVGSNRRGRRADFEMADRGHVGMPWSPITIRLVTVSRVLTDGLKRSVPCTAIVYAGAVESIVTTCPGSILTT